MLRKRHDVTIIAGGEDKEGQVGLPTFYVPGGKKYMEKNGHPFAWPTKSKLENALKDVDIVQVQTPFWLGMKTIKIAKKLGKPVVTGYYVQGENIFYNLGIKSKTLIDKTNKFFVNRVYNKSNAVICISNFASDELNRFGLKAKDYVVSSGIPDRFKPVFHNNDPFHNKNKNCFVILSVGRIARDKRHDLIIKAVASSKYKDLIQIVFVGEGPMKEKMMKLGKILPNSPVFLSKISDEELVNQYNNADLYVHPSEVELESLTVLEAMACGRTPLISDAKTSAAKQFALDERFLFENGNEQSLASKIDFWMENKDKLAQSDKMYLNASKNYSIKESAKKLEDIYFQYVGK